MAAASTQGPRAQAAASDNSVHAIATYKPQRPGMRPEGMGLCGSLMASTSRSNQSLTAWLVAQTSGPASSTPAATSHQRPSSEAPEATAPQAKAHIGGNQVIGLSSSATAETLGSAGDSISACCA